mgnify:CR=1 FL=1
MRVQEQHDLADDLLLGPRLGDPLRALGANAVHLAQALGRLLDNVEDPLAKGIRKLSAIDPPNATDHPGGEVGAAALR